MEQNSHGMAKKTKNAFSKCILEFNFAPISGPYFFIFQKKSKSMYPNVPIYDIMNKGLAAIPGSSNHSILSQPSAEFSNLI